MEAIMVLFAVFGLLYLGWLLLGRILVTERSKDGELLYAVLRAEGDGERLEQEVNRLFWLCGDHRMFRRIVLADAGLTQEGLRVAEQLTKKWPELDLCPVEELEHWLTDS